MYLVVLLLYILALKAIGIKKGDRVATVSHTFRATVAARIKYVGAKPVYVDIEQLSYCMDPYDLGNTLDDNPDIKAVIYVHLYGNTGMVDVIADLCKKKSKTNRRLFTSTRHF